MVRGHIPREKQIRQPIIVDVSHRHSAAVIEIGIVQYIGIVILPKGVLKMYPRTILSHLSEQGRRMSASGQTNDNKQSEIPHRRMYIFFLSNIHPTYQQIKVYANANNKAP